jgi:hypothetical protein
MPPIEGNFNKELELLWGGKGVAARGPLDWGKEEPGDERLTLMLHVAITQDDTGVAASGRTGDDIPHGANEFLVVAAVEGDGKLQPGPAMARGLALAREEGLETYDWSSRVMLKEGPPPAHLADDLAPGRAGTHH